MDDGKRARPFSFEELNLEVDEKRRKKFLQDLETFSALNEATDLINSDISFESQARDLNDFDDTLEESGLGVPADLQRGSISEILAFPEFVTCLDSQISREAELIKDCLSFVRPEGSRVLVQIKNHLATVYNKDGYVKTAFKIDLKGPTMLDCIFYSPEPTSSASRMKPVDSYTTNLSRDLRVYYVSDILQLNGRILTTSELECRLFFLDSILDEINCSPNVIFKSVKYEEVGTDRLKSIYDRARKGDFEYETDSILFVNRSAHYVGGYNPNWLCFKDQVLSKYCIQDEVVCKVYHRDGKLYTHDNVLIGEFDSATGAKILKISIEDIDYMRIKFKVVSPVKGAKNPDSLRKIYVNFNNHRHTSEDNFGRLLQSLRRHNL